MGKVLVVGGAGYLGMHVTEVLGERAVVFDNLLYTPSYFEPLQFVFGDVTNPIHLALTLKRRKYDAVIWLAAIVGDAACALNPVRAMAVNLDSIKQLTNRFDGRIIFTSSCSLYGANDEVATEETLLNPLSIYAETKMKAEEVLVRHGNSLILRLGTLHGQSKRMRFDLMVNAMTLSAYSKGVVTVFGGTQYRPLLNVWDAADFIVKMVDYNWTPGVYNLASENACVSDVANAVTRIVTDARIERRDIGFEDRRNYMVDSSKAYEELEFAPHTPYGASIMSIVELLKSGRIKDPYDPRYYNIKALGGGNGT